MPSPRSISLTYVSDWLPMFTVVPSCWGCNDIGMHFRITMEYFFTLWSNNGKATVCYLVDGRGDFWTKPLNCGDIFWISNIPSLIVEFTFQYRPCLPKIWNPRKKWFTYRNYGRLSATRIRKARLVVIGDPPFWINCLTTQLCRSPDQAKGYNENCTCTAIQKHNIYSVLARCRTLQQLQFT